MRRRLSFLALAFLVLLILFPTSALATTRGINITSKQGQSLYLYKDYRALVVGVSNYEKWPDLPNAVKDAREVATHLGQLGFEVKLVLNPSSREMKSALTEVVYGMGNQKNRALLIYFAGHGETLELADGTELGYIIPSDCPLKMKDPMGFDDKAVSMKEMEILALKVKSKHLLMVFDSCFSGSIFNLVRAAPLDISEKSAMPVRQFITAGGAGEQVPDQSVFKVVFLNGIAGDADLNGDGYITGSELGMHLQEKVVNYSRGGQHPQYGKINNPKLDRGDFVFLPSEGHGKEVAEETDSEEAAEKMALEEELNRLRAEMEKTSRTVRELQAKEAQEKRLAYAPKTTRSVYDKLRNGQGPFVVDDFEDGDLWSIYFNDKWSYRTRGHSTLAVSVDTAQGANGTTSSMKIEYKLNEQSATVTGLGGRVRIKQVKKDRSKAYDLSRFNKISFYLKGEKKKTFFSKPNKLFVNIGCFGKRIKANYGKFAEYHNRTEIVPDTAWKKVEIPFDDLVVSNRTRLHATHYPDNPNIHNVLFIYFVFSSFPSHDGYPGSNTVWIDEITLE
ncbi:MAG: CIA30 family protein [Desulfobacteraceae bacterium]|jgi:hypothetical protein